MSKRTQAIPDSQYQHLLDCYRSGQIEESAWQDHLKDKGFREWVEGQTEPSNEPELKPCPFCGGGAFGMFVDKSDSTIGCMECTFTTGQITPIGPRKSKAEAIRAWNTRTADSDTALIGELVEALEKLQRQALQSDVNDPANEWGREALEFTASALTRARKRTGGA